MNRRTAFGAVVAAAAALSLVLYAATWLKQFVPPPGVWPFFARTALVLVSRIVSAQVMKPHSQVDRVLQLSKLKPFLTELEYKSIWAAFAFTLIALQVGMLQVGGGADTDRSTFQVFAAGWFGFLYIDAIILLRARFPKPPYVASEA